MRTTFISDVDGCVARLIPGFTGWVKEQYDIDFDHRLITVHNDMGSVSNLWDVQEALLGFFPGPEAHSRGIGGALHRFMAEDDVYQRYVKVEEGAQEAMGEIAEVADIVFCTANMKRVPQNYASKFWWLGQHFPGIPVISCPSELKQMVRGTFCVDDRWDICERWRLAGVRPFCFEQPWNEAPTGTDLYTWSSISALVRHACGAIDPGRYTGEF